MVDVHQIGNAVCSASTRAGRERLQSPSQQPLLNKRKMGGSCIRLRPERPKHVWSYEFVADRTHDGKAFRMLCIIDEFIRESLMIRVARKLRATDVMEALCELFVLRGIPAHIRSDNGPEFVAQALRDRIAAVGARPHRRTLAKEANRFFENECAAWSSGHDGIPATLRRRDQIHR